MQTRIRTPPPAALFGTSHIARRAFVSFDALVTVNDLKDPGGWDANADASSFHGSVGFSSGFLTTSVDPAAGGLVKHDAVPDLKSKTFGGGNGDGCACSGGSGCSITNTKATVEGSRSSLLLGLTLLVRRRRR